MNEDFFLPLFVLGIPAVAVYAIMNTYLSHKLKNKMIEKGYVDDASQAIFKGQKTDYTLSSLKWGLIILFGGVALTALEYIPYSYNSPFPFGFVAIGRRNRWQPHIKTMRVNNIEPFVNRLENTRIYYIIR